MLVVNMIEMVTKYRFILVTDLISVAKSLKKVLATQSCYENMLVTNSE